MVKRCVAANCSDTYKDGVSLFKFPKDKKLRQLWKKQVQRTRAKWKGPSDFSYLCSCHFTEDCFEAPSSTSSNSYQNKNCSLTIIIYAEEIGYKTRQMLKSGAVPSIFPTNNSRPATSYQHAAAFEKRSQARV